MQLVKKDVHDKTGHTGGGLYIQGYWLLEQG